MRHRSVNLGVETSVVLLKLCDQIDWDRADNPQPKNGIRHSSGRLTVTPETLEPELETPYCNAELETLNWNAGVPRKGFGAPQRSSLP